MNSTIRYVHDLRVVAEEYVVYRGPKECVEPDAALLLNQFGPHYLSSVKAYMPNGQIARLQIVHTMKEVWDTCGSDIVESRVQAWRKKVRVQLDELLLTQTEHHRVMQ